MTDRRGHLELARGSADSRLFIHLLLNFIHRADHERRGLYGAAQAEAPLESPNCIQMRQLSCVEQGIFSVVLSAAKDLMPFQPARRWQSL